MKLYRKTFEVDAVYDRSSRRRAFPTEEVPGRWVPWCVTHGCPRDDTENAYATDSTVPVVRSEACRGAEGDIEMEPCRWHPLGAFIPEEGDE